MAKDKKNIIIISLSVIVVVLLLVLGYFFLLRPSMNGLVIQGQNEGYNYALSLISQQAATCPTSGIPLPLGNITIHLFAIECLQSQQSMQESQVANSSPQ